ncbi:MAG: prenyltransferase [Coprobacillaceae bacterium]
MTIEKQYISDVEAIISHRYDQGDDYWTTSDKRLIKGAPFSALESSLFLLELGMEPTDPMLKKTTELFFDTWQEDGRFKLYPKGGIFPCQVAIAASFLCHMGYVEDIRIQETLKYLLEIQYTDGGWRCNKFYFGRGPETEYSNPHPTLMTLDAFRFSQDFNKEPVLDKAVEFLLNHWTIKKPIGPCHYGIGSLFMQVEYPFRNYNLFLYVYVLSFYDKAKKDPRFLEAFEALQAKTQNGQIIVERVVPKLAKFTFCKKGQPSTLATKRYHEILRNLGITY